MFCTQCGRRIEDRCRFCPNCGAAVTVGPARPALYDSWYDQGEPEPGPEFPIVQPAPAFAAVPMEDPRIALMKRAFNLNTLATLVVFAVQSLVMGLSAAALVLYLLLPVLRDGYLSGNPFDILGKWSELAKDPSTATLAGLAYAGIYLISMLLGLLISGLLRRQVTRVSIERHTLPFGRFVMVALVTFGVWGVGALLGNWPQFVAPVELDSTLERSIPMLLVTMIGAPVFEELIFRKFLIDRLLPFGERTAVIFTALLFGMAHQNAMQFFLAFFVGLVFAIVYIRTGNILYTMLLHFMINTFASLDTIGCMIFGDVFDTIWLIAAGVLILAGLVTLLVCRKRPFFSAEPNYIPGANRAAFRCWGMILCKVIVTLEIVIYAILMVVASENRAVGLVHLIPAAAAIALIFIVAGRASSRVAPAPEMNFSQNVTES